MRKRINYFDGPGGVYYDPCHDTIILLTKTDQCACYYRGGPVFRLYHVQVAYCTVAQTSVVFPDYIVYLGEL